MYVSRDISICLGNLNQTLEALFQGYMFGKNQIPRESKSFEGYKAINFQWINTEILNKILFSHKERCRIFLMKNLVI